MTCANCGTRTPTQNITEFNPTGDTYYCPYCSQSAVHLIAIMPDGSTVPPLPQEANTLTLNVNLLHMLAAMRGRAILEWYDGEYTHLLYVK